jgi:hypothetical protein
MPGPSYLFFYFEIIDAAEILLLLLMRSSISKEGFEFG